jgi:hypothetical protein
MVCTALALVAGTLILAPIAATQNDEPSLSQTPPVPLAPATTPTTTTISTTTSGQPAKLPKTGLDMLLLVALGAGLTLAGTALRLLARTPSRRTG